MTPQTQTDGKEQLKVQQTVTSLSTMDDVKLGKIIDFTPVKSNTEALAAVNNDAERLINVLNLGLKAELRQLAKEDETGWHKLLPNGELGEEFSGEMADAAKVNQLVTVFAKYDGYGPSKTPEQKKAIKLKAKQTAKNILLNDPDMRAKVSLGSGSEDEFDTTTNDEGEV